MSPLPDTRTRRGWSAKFGDAFRGLKVGIQGQTSFLVHFLVAALALLAGVVLQVDRIDWCLLTLAIFGVLTAELFNSALESLAKAITDETHPHVGYALDIGSGAVLLAALGASTLGIIVFVPRALELML